MSFDNADDGDIELQSIHVDNTVESVRCDCWNYNVSDQFPIKSMRIENEKAYVEVGPPHEGYTIESRVENGLIYGQSKIYSIDRVIVASLVYVDGVATGPCILYDESGVIYFKGYFENGYKQGRGTEYDEKKNIVFDGFYDKGVKRSIYPLGKRKNSWVEYDEHGHYINIGQRDNYGRLCGICYLFNSEEDISKISIWDKGEEVSVLKEFIDGKMIEYRDGVRFYEGSFRDSFQLDYPYEGEGKEYQKDGQTVLYHGNYYNGKRYGRGLEYHNNRIRYKGVWLNGHLPWVTVTSILILQLLLLILTAVLTCIILYSIDRFLILFSICIVPVIYGILSVISIKLFDYLMLEKPDGPIWNKHKKTNYSNRKNLPKNTEYANTRPLDNAVYIDIFTNCFQFASEFYVNGLNRLRRITIESGSFVSSGDYSKDISKSFHVLNCEALESITIGTRCFYSFAGQFELNNLPSLKEIIIGQRSFIVNSDNFYYSSFIVRGNSDATF